MLIQVALLSLLSSWAMFESQDTPSIQAQIVDIHFLGGATEADSVMFGVSVEIPSSCYGVKKVAFRFNKDKKTFLLYPELRRLKLSPCEDEKRVEKVMVDLGHNLEGRYEIRELVSLKRWAKFDIFNDLTTDQVLISFNKSH